MEGKVAKLPDNMGEGLTVAAAAEEADDDDDDDDEDDDAASSDFDNSLNRRGSLHRR